MPMYAGIDGAKRKLTAPPVGIDGAKRNLTSVWAGDSGAKRKIFSSGNPIGDLPVGSIVKVPESGVPQEYLIVHQGLPSSMYDASCDGAWLLRKDIIALSRWTSSFVAYPNSLLDSWLNENLIPAFSNSLAAKIKSVKIPYAVKNGLTYIVNSGSNGHPCKTFICCGFEIGFTESRDKHLPKEGSVLSFFSDLQTSASRRIAYFNGNPTKWWTRSANHYNQVYFFADAFGNLDAVSGNDTLGIRPAFILPPDTPIDADNNVIA